MAFSLAALGAQAPSEGELAVTSNPVYYADLTGEWDMVIAGHLGVMSIMRQEGSLFSGLVYTEDLVAGQLSGTNIRFVRLWADGSQQEFSGTLDIDIEGKAAMRGTFSKNGNGSFLWVAKKKTRIAWPESIQVTEPPHS
ncbi:MAG TPA: hypothetical protein VN445_13250 [Rectinemataceae bacterium]|nr:hypothetical protein [Rectinemataceae bacterium]